MHRSPILATLGVLIFSATTFAAQAKTHEAWATGQIQRVDQDAHALVIKQGAHEMTFTLAADAHMMQGKKALQANDLAGDVGRTVKVRYTTNGDSKVADRVQVSDAAPAKTTASKTSKK